MPSESKHGTPTPPGENRPGPVPQIECAEFEVLIADALEGLLTAERQQSFDAHRRVCEICGPMFVEVQAGQQWLKSLEEVEPPAHLVYNILAATSGVVSTRALEAAGGRKTHGRETPWAERLRERWDTFFAPLAAFVRQPRFVMSFGMIFFSFSLALSAAGVKGSDLAKISLRPEALRHTYNDASIKVVQYYDNIRFVYEIESKLRELRRANTPAEPAPVEQKGTRKNNTSGQPNERQDRNYSRENNQLVLADMTRESNGVCSRELRAAGYEQSPARSWLKARSSKPPVVTLSTTRRYV